MRKANRIISWALSAALLVSAGADVRACAFHGYTPNPTFVDLLLATEQVVIAESSSTDPRRYVPVATVLGPEVREMPIGVSPMMRKALDAQPGTRMLLARDGAYGPWIEIVPIDGRYQKVIEEVAARQSRWLAGYEDDRLAYFAARVNDPNEAIRDLALRELDRAPYGALRAQKLPKIKGLKAGLARGDDGLLPIRVLLAGLSGDGSFRAPLTGGLNDAIGAQVPYVGAYVTALVELGGAGAVREIVAAYERAGVHNELTRERLVQALSVQYKSAPRPLRRALAKEVAVLVREKPEFADAATRHFGFQGGWRRSR